MIYIIRRKTKWCNPRPIQERWFCLLLSPKHELHYNPQSEPLFIKSQSTITFSSTSKTEEMVLGLRTKSRRDNGVFVEYLISIKELKPWPTSQVPVQCVLLKWQNGENSSGSFIAVVGKDTIMFNESFRLALTLEPKGVDDKKFHKNLLELHVYDAKKKDKGVKNKLLGSAVVNLADYGVLTNSVPVGAPFTFKKSSRNDANSEIYLTIEPAGDDDGYRSSSSSQPKMRGSVDKEGSEFSLASLTDDDDDSSSQCSSSRRVSFSATCDANPMVHIS